MIGLRSSHKQARRRCLFAGALTLIASLVHSPAAWSAPPSPAVTAPPLFAERHPDLRPPDPEQETDGGKARLQRAREHFAQGAAALAAKDYAECEKHYARAWVLQPSAGNASNLAQCENRLGYYVDAAEHLRDAQARIKPEDMDEASLRRFEERTKAERQIAMAQVATLDVQDAPAGAVISLGPKLRFSAPIQRMIFLYPGEYVLEVSTAEGMFYTARLHVLAGQSYVHSVRPKPREKPEKPPDAAGPNVALVVAGGGTAAAFLGAGIGLVAASHARLSDAAALRAEIGALFGAQTGGCHAPAGALSGLCRKLEAATYDAGTFERLGIAAVVASGGLSLATATYALWPRPAPPSGAPKSSEGPRVQEATVTVTPGGLGVTITGVW